MTVSALGPGLPWYAGLALCGAGGALVPVAVRWAHGWVQRRNGGGRRLIPSDEPLPFDNWNVEMAVRQLIEGDRNPALWRDGPVPMDYVRRVIEAMPPLSDTHIAEGPLEGGIDYRVPLLTDDGPTGVSLMLRREVDGFRLAVLEIAGPAPAPVDELPRPRDDGRLPAHKFVGSRSLRVARFMAALPDDLDHLEAAGSPVYSAWALLYADGDIYNGGLDQFFYNSTGNFADRYPDFAVAIGATEKASIIREANDLFAGVELRDREARYKHLLRLEKVGDVRLDDLTGRYYDSDDDISELLADYIAANPESFLY